MKRYTTITHSVIVATTLLAASCAQVSSLHEPAAISAVRAEAEHGDAENQYRMGLLYTNGKEVPQDYATAREWFYLAAQKDHADSQYMLGVALTSGRGIRKNHEQAATWFAKAAKQGHVHAQYQLADALMNGRGVRKEPEWAAFWLGKAANSGHQKSQFVLGVARASGIGLPVDYAEAWKWLRLAEKNGHIDARKVRAQIALRMNPQQMKRAQAQVVAWKPQHTNGFGDAAAVQYVQNALNALGYRKGSINGRSDRMTFAAVTAYRQAAGLPPGHHVNGELVQQLRADLAAQSVAATETIDKTVAAAE